MLQRGTGGRAVVLEDENVAEPKILSEIDHAVAIGPQHVLDLLSRKIGEAFDMAGGFDDDFMGAHAVHAVARRAVEAQ